jgi:hypothetical protein
MGGQRVANGGGRAEDVEGRRDKIHKRKEASWRVGEMKGVDGSSWSVDG